jgi:hypothetical protein
MNPLLRAKLYKRRPTPAEASDPGRYVAHLVALTLAVMAITNFI